MSERSDTLATPIAQHARHREAGIRTFFIAAASAALVFGGSGAVTAAVTGGMVAELAEAPPIALPQPVDRPTIGATVQPMPAEGLPAPTFDVTAAGTALCDDPDFLRTLESGDDAAVIDAAGGAETFRSMIATGTAACIPLDDPTRAWVVVNKQRPFAPNDYTPFPLAMPATVQSLEGGELRSDAADALDAMAQAARAAGAGDIAMESGYRSYATQQTTYRGHVGDRGVEGADLVSARPGFSEHQSGLGADVVACGEAGCGTIDELAATTQGAWITEHAWEHGWIVRYLDGRTDVTGYLPEPWHLRYVGPEIARLYHDGGYSTLEEFFGLPAAPDYAS
ncbi:M15 family metallopeptidase [Microbacterium sp. P05]|uniref:M15 family metallopeptidase n=1 Tax=Microbacterium sp. P05 TaxID=3366948 RepID=UPI0037462C41